MFILNEEIKEQERQAIKELYPKFSDTTVIVTKVPLKPFYKAHRIQYVAMAHVTRILAKYGYLEVSGDKVALRYRRTKESISLPDLVIKTMQKLHPYKGNIREIKSYLTTELIKLDASRSSTLTGIELMKITPL